MNKLSEKEAERENGPHDGNVENQAPLGWCERAPEILERGIKRVPGNGCKEEGVKKDGPWGIAVHPFFTCQGIGREE